MSSQQEILRAHGIRPVKRRGQNFLIDGNLARAIALDTLALGARVLELGAGGGALTTHLLDGAERVVCVEIDRKLCAVLEDQFAARENFRLICGDLARLDWEAAVSAAGPLPVVAGNLPYVLTSKVLFALADLREVTAGGVFMVQKEVAERLVAEPGGKDYGILAVVMGAVFDIRIRRTVPPTVFWPRPEVESAVVSLTPGGGWKESDYRRLVELARALFGKRRKKLRTLWRTLYGGSAAEAEETLGAAGVDPDHRPEQIDAAGWRRLVDLTAGRN